MQLLKSILLLSTICFFCLQGHAQTKKMDSLNVLLNQTKEDTSRASIYLELCNECEMKDNKKYASALIALCDKLISQSNNKHFKTGIIKKKAKAYDFLVYFYDQTNNSEGKLLECYQQKLKLFESINDLEGIKNTLIDISDYYKLKGDIFKQMKALKNGLAYFEKRKNKNGMSRFITQLGLFYASQGDSTLALSYLERGMKVEKEIGDTTRIARGFFLLGVFYSKMSRYEKALENLNKAKERYEKVNDKVFLADIYIEIGKIYKRKNEIDKAKENLEKCISYAEQSGYVGALGGAYNTIGDMHRESGDLKKALAYHQKSKAIAAKYFQKYGIGLADVALAKDYLTLKNVKLAKQNADEALVIFKESGVVQGMFDGERLCAQIDSASGNFKDAFFHYQQYIYLRDKLNDDEVHKASQREKFQNEFEKQKTLDRLSRKKQTEEAALESKKQKMIIGFVGLALMLVIIVAIFIFSSLRKTRKQKQIIELQKKEVEQQNEEISTQRDEIENQKHLIEEHQKEMVDSITYAKRIQDAILPPIESIKEKLPETFVLYKPKDIVAGDFYWMEEIDNTILIAAADCTGHGVPGAMVSVVCSNALNRAVKEFHLKEPGKILDKVTDLVLETFEKSIAEVKDGMDISLLSINKITKEIKWSGANNPLWYFEPAYPEGRPTPSPSKEGSYGLVEITADKQPIGKSDYRKPFTTHTIEYKSNAIFYLFTDGYADQFGGPKGKKYKYKQFQETLSSCLKDEMTAQHKAINNSFENWKGKLEQVDDVCVIGIRV